MELRSNFSEFASRVSFNDCVPGGNAKIGWKATEDDAGYFGPRGTRVYTPCGHLGRRRNDTEVTLKRNPKTDVGDFYRSLDSADLVT